MYVYVHIIAQSPSISRKSPTLKCMSSQGRDTLAKTSASASSISHHRCVAVYCSVLQCVAVCCSVLQCVAVR